MIKFPELTEEQKKRIGENLKNNRVINDCAKAIVSMSIELGVDYFSMNLKDTQYEGVSSGDWKITVEQIKE